MAVVRYLVHDVDAALAFYALLGFVLDDRMGPPFAIAKRGDLKLWLSGPGTSAARTLPDGSKPTSGGWNRLVIEVADIAQTVETLRTAGAKFRSDPISGPGGQQVLVGDPSGNPIELFQPRKN
jgi:catechol 2,3-dioxygenase-like lactoylglutathione lyase family enzyme